MSKGTAISQDQLFVYKPFQLSCFNSCSDKLEAIFNKKCYVIEKIPCKQKISDGVLWLDAHGLQHPGKTGYMLAINKESVDSEYQDELYESDRPGVSFLPSSVLPMFFDVHKSIIILDNCYSSQVAIDTLTQWKDNMIFTTGYIRDYYNDVETGIVKAIGEAMDELKKNGIETMSYRTVKDNKALINDLFAKINKEYDTQYNLF